MSKEPFVHIEGWMTKLGFPAPKMIVYAIVYALCHNDPDPNPKGAYCSMAYFAKYAMVSKTTVRKYIKELVLEGFFARRVEFIYDGKMQKNYLWANAPEDRNKEIEGFSYEWEAFGDDTERLVKIQKSWEKRKQEKNENEEFIEEGGYSSNLRGYSSNLRGGTQVSGGGTQVSLGHNNIKITSSSITKRNFVSKETKQKLRVVGKDGKVCGGNPLTERAYELWNEIMGQPCKRDKWNSQAGWNMMRAKNKGEDWLRKMLIIARECKKDPKADFRASHVANLADLQKNQDAVMGWARNVQLRKNTEADKSLDFLRQNS